MDKQYMVDRQEEWIPVRLKLEDGTVRNCAVVTELTTPDGRHYAVLLPIEESADDSLDLEGVYLYRLLKEGEREILENIPEKKEYEAVRAVFLDWLEQQALAEEKTEAELRNQNRA